MSVPTLPPALRGPVTTLVDDLQDLFGPRLLAVVAYGPRLDQANLASGPPLNTLALVDQLGVADLTSAGARAAAWDRAGLAMPLLLARDEFARSLDAFPFEYGDIIARHVPLHGTDPFHGLRVDPNDLRRACETAAKGHLIHLREGFLETRGRGVDLARLIVESAPPFATLLGQIARLRGADGVAATALADTAEGVAGLPAAVVRDVVALVARPVLSNDEAQRLFPAYLAAVERLVAYVDGWRQ